MEVRDRRKIYHNVHTFIHAARLAEDDFEPSSMCRRFQRCFLGKAASWFEQTVSDTDRALWRRGPTIDRWRMYDSLEYSLYDVYRRRDPELFLQEVVVYGQEAREATTEQAQVHAAYNKLSPSLQMTLAPPDQNNTISGFSRQLRVRKSQWFVNYKMSEYKEDLTGTEGERRIKEK
ncbi:hypothetical protein N7488_005075 [Penicillium malachiteum]|nr:hypothetical protein N7488_005075 [Penicillium malachiteum]